MIDTWSEDLHRLGYAVIPLLDADGVVALAEVAERFLPGTLHRFWSTSRDPDNARRRAVHEAVRAVLEDPLRDVLPEYRSALCSLVAKPPQSADGEVPLHQDWSFVDDQQWRSYNVWCSLVDVDESNGCLQVVPGSHASARQPRAAGSAFFYEELEPVLRRHLRSVPMRAGDALLFDHCLFHCSPPNRSSRLRVGATAALLPVGVPMLYYHATGGGSVEVYEVPDDVHLRHDPGSPPPDGRLVGHLQTRLQGSAAAST
ncbi:MAG: Protein involved in biosynthesis of mitomycin antibiotics/polyketide fumonisin [Actinotalea sp.]|nr:Protein involved in biosynthesis of mitomycin antibiotics/polyketide fumonisin [Actinotalea sp.]